MLEALVRTSQDIPPRRRGDIICVKLKSHAEWGKEECRFHQPINLEDAELEQKIIDAQNSFGGFVFLTHPYEEKTDEGQIKTMSSTFFDFDKISDLDLKTKILSNTEKVFPEDITDNFVRQKTEEEINIEFEENKNAE